MNRRQFLAGTSAGIAATTAGCMANALSSDNTEVATQATGDDNEIIVRASGEATADPDAASLSVGIEARGNTAEDVTDKLATKAKKVRKAFDELGIPDEQVEESGYEVYPVREHEKYPREQREDDGSGGYKGRRSFQLTVTDVSRVGTVIDTVTAAGADDVGRVTFSLQEQTHDNLRKKALNHALSNADDEASHIANNRGVTITGTKAVTTEDVQLRPVHVTSDAMAESGSGGRPPTEINADPVSVTASVTVTYGFK